MESSSQDRNLPATERKLQKARDDGQVARSRDLSHLAVLGTGALSLLVLTPVMFNRLRVQVSQQLLFDASLASQPGVMLARLQDMVILGLLGCTIFAAIVGTAAVLGTIATGGWVASFKPLAPDFSRLNPITGFARLFTKDKLTDVLKMTFMTVVLVAALQFFWVPALKQSFR